MSPSTRYRPAYFLVGVVLISTVIYSCSINSNDLNTASNANMPVGATDNIKIEKTNVEFNLSYLNKAREIGLAYGEKEALPYYQKAAEMYESEKVWEGALISLNEIGLYYLDQRSFDSALITLEKSLSLGNTYLDSANLSLSTTNFLLGRYYEETNDPFKAFKFHQKALDNRLQQLGPNNHEVAVSYKGFGDLYSYRLNDYPNALKYFNKSLNIMESLPDTDGLDIMKNYYAIYSCYRNLGDLKNAEIFIMQAKDMCEKLPGDNISRLTQIYTAIGILFYNKKEFDESLKYYNKAIAMVENNLGDKYYRLGNYFNNIGSAYKLMADKYLQDHDSIKAELAFKKAKQSLKSALNINQFNQNKAWESTSYYILGWIYTANDQIDSALYYYNHCLKLRIETFGSSSRMVADVYEDLGALYKNIDSLENSLNYFQRALVTLVNDFNGDDLLKNPEPTEQNYQPRLYELLGNKGEVLRKLYDRTQDLIYLKAALDAYLALDNLNDIARSSYQHEDSKLFYRENEQPNLQKAVASAYTLNEITEDPYYLEVFFKFIEKSKYLLLFESLYKAEQFGGINVPDSLYELENSLKSKFSYYQQQKLAEEARDNVDKALIESYNQQLFDINRDQIRAREIARKQFPEYYSIKYDSLGLKLNGLKKILNDKESQVIEYYWGNQYIYALNLGKDKVNHLKIPITDSLISHIDRYRQMVTNNKEFTNKNNFTVFKESAHKIYRWLLEPLLDSAVTEKKTTQLIIIPDGKLSFIPFSALLTKPVTTDNIDYRNLPYMIRDYEISYTYSANLLFKAREKRSETKNPTVLALSYSRDSDSNGTFPNEILGTAHEVNGIKSNTTNGKFYMGEEATEDNFKAMAPTHDILHLAIHGQANDSTSNSMLMFKKDSSSIEDGILHDFELYNLKLKAKLVVLSACETGIGKQFKGEGIYSMARGFAYAGCPSIIMSYWKANDNTTPKLMSQFYKYLTDGNTIDHSLRKAKLDYINDADEFSAHPATWAALVPLGDVNKPVFQNNGKIEYFYYFLAGLLMISVFVFIYIKKYNV